MEFAGSLLPESLGVVPAVALIAASFFTSTLTAAFGVGGGVAMLTLMGLVIPVASLIPLHGAVQLGSNTGRAWHQRAHIDFAAATPFIAGSLVGVAIGAALVIQLPDGFLKTLLAVFIIAVVWTKIPGFDKLGNAGFAVGGGVIALITMFVGATGPMLSAFFSQVFPDDRKRLVATNAAGMTVHHGLKVLAFVIAGFAFTDWLPFIVAMIASGYVGTMAGSKLLGIIEEKTFRYWFRIGLTGLALLLLHEGLVAISA